jgi:hypothetical protein
MESSGRWDGRPTMTCGRPRSNGQDRTANGGWSRAVENRKQVNSNYHSLGNQIVKIAKNLTMDFIHYELLHLMG